MAKDRKSNIRLALALKVKQVLQNESTSIIRCATFQDYLTASNVPGADIDFARREFDKILAKI